MLISAQEWQSILERASLLAFQPAVERLRAEVDDFLAQPSVVQTEPGGYYHDYFCPTHGVQLRFDLTSPTVHRCPVDEAVWHGEAFDAAWRWFVNNRLAEISIRLALCWRLEGDPAYLTAVSKILRDYADRYATYQAIKSAMSDPGANPGVATYTTLDESVWVLPLAWAFDMVREQLDAEERAHISQALLAPAAEHLVARHFRGIHNFACWHNAAIGTLGVVIDRPDLVAFALHSDYGFERQVRDGVLGDGLWFEGSFSYHFYTLAALMALVKAMRHLPGHDLRNHPAPRAMLLAPIQAAYPDWSLPAPNDCWYFTSLLADCCHGVPPAPAFYEVAYAWYSEPLFAQVLQRAYQQSPRDSLDALLFGVAALPIATPDPLPSVNLPASGYAILRDMPTAGSSMADQQRYLLLKYGPHGEGHGHPDKLNLLLYANGQRLSADLGTPGYGLDLFESWYRQTVSHNTITLDGCSQPEATGVLHRFWGDGLFQIADAAVSWPDDETTGAAGNPYRGATMRRVILARPDYFLDLVVVQTPQPRRMDWIYHNIGALTSTLISQPAGMTNADGEGYQHIANAQRATVITDFVAIWQTERGGVKLFSAGSQENTVITGVTPGNPPTDQRMVLIQQRQGSATAYLTLFHPYQAAPRVTSVEWAGRNLLEDSWVGCLVQIDGRHERWRIRLTADVVLPVQDDSGSMYFDYCLA